MKESIVKHFNKLYNRLLFLDTDVGTNEKTYRIKTYYHKSIENEKLIKKEDCIKETVDDYTFLKKNGLVLRIRHDEWCKKYQKLEIDIKKDSYYNGNKRGSIKDILEELNIYLKNNSKDFYEKINQVIHQSDASKDIKIDYKKSDLFKKDNIKSITLSNTIINNEDFELLQDYPSLRMIIIKDSVINANNLSHLKLSSIIIEDSKLASLRCLNNVSCYGMNLNNITIIDEKIKPIRLNVENLTFDNVSIDYKLLFLCTDFRGLKKLSIQKITLNQVEVELLKVFYEVRELTVDGKASSFDFLTHLPNLEIMNGHIDIVDENNLNKLKERYRKYLLKEDFLNDEKFIASIYYREKNRCIELNKFNKKIKLSKPSLSYWSGKIASSTLEDVRELSNLPTNIKGQFGYEEPITFVKTNYMNPFDIILGKTEESLLSNIVGPNNQKLIKPSASFIKNFYILSKDGSVLERIEVCEEQNITVEEYHTDYREDCVDNDDIFDYYYNQQVSEQEKLSYLANKIKVYYESKETSALKDTINKDIPDDIIASRYVTLTFKEVTKELENYDFLPWYLSNINTFLEEFAINEEEKDILIDYILMRQCRLKVDLIEEREICNQKLFELEETVTSILGWYSMTEGIDKPDELLRKNLISKDEYNLIMEYLKYEDRVSKITQKLDIDTKAREKCYEKMIPEIDNLSTKDLKIIKNIVVKTTEASSQFNKFTDYIYYYLYQDYPEWIKTELIKYQVTNKKHENTSAIEKKGKTDIHIKAYSKVIKNIFDY